MTKKKQNIKITQEDGFVKIHRNGEYEQGYDLNRVVEKIKDGTMTNVSLANWMAELINDALNCTKVSSALTDLNDTKTYRGTYFEGLDYME